MVQWFFRNALLPYGVCALASQLFGVKKINRRRFKQGGGKWDRDRLGLGVGNKRREGVTRLIKLFYQSKLQNLQVQNFI